MVGQAKVAENQRKVIWNLCTFLLIAAWFAIFGSFSFFHLIIFIKKSFGRESLVFLTQDRLMGALFQRGSYHHQKYP